MFVGPVGFADEIFPMETENRKIGILGNRNMIFPNFPNDILLKIHYGNPWDIGKGNHLSFFWVVVTVDTPGE